MQKIENYIDGKLVAPIADEYLDNFNPATAEVYSLIPDSDEREVELAVEAAQRAFPVWSKTSHEERFEILMRLVRLIERDLDILAEAESVDNGKPVSLAKRVDIPRAAANFRPRPARFARQGCQLGGGADGSRVGSGSAIH